MEKDLAEEMVDGLICRLGDWEQVRGDKYVATREIDRRGELAKEGRRLLIEWIRALNEFSVEFSVGKMADIPDPLADLYWRRLNAQRACQEWLGLGEEKSDEAG